MTLQPEVRYRVLLSDCAVDWAVVDSVAQLRPYFDRAKCMADVIRNESLLKNRRTLFLAGGLHVSKEPRVRRNQVGVPIGEITPIAWLELRHPGSTYVVQSMGSASRLGLQELVGAGPPRVLFLDIAKGPGKLGANRTTTLRNRDGSTPDVYGDAVLAEIVDAVILWDPYSVTLLDADPEVYQVNWYWEELNRRSIMLTGQPMDPSLRRRDASVPAR